AFRDGEGRGGPRGGEKATACERHASTDLRGGSPGNQDAGGSGSNLGHPGVDVQGRMDRLQGPEASK
ncbi:MAG: hypothetical protein Q8M74_04900, partial [Chloroflexota bacterium]|nr:hypothetical protein [Chloroflexota bacterium]